MVTMRYRKPTHPVTSDMRREISVAALAKAGAFKRPMRFPFQRIEVTARDHIRLLPMRVQPGIDVRGTSQAHQVVRVTWRKLRYGLRPFFVCSRCNKRRVFLYFDGLQAYCRVCSGVWYWLPTQASSDALAALVTQAPRSARRSVWKTRRPVSSPAQATKKNPLSPHHRQTKTRRTAIPAHHR